MGTCSPPVSVSIAVAAALQRFDFTLEGTSLGSSKHLYFFLQEFADATPQVLTERQKHNAMVMEILKEASKTDENVAHKPWPWKK